MKRALEEDPHRDAPQDTQCVTIDSTINVNRTCVLAKGILCTECDDGLGVKEGYLCETCLSTGENAARLSGTLLASGLVLWREAQKAGQLLQAGRFLPHFQNNKNCRC